MLLSVVAWVSLRSDLVFERLGLTRNTELPIWSTVGNQQIGPTDLPQEFLVELERFFAEQPEVKDLRIRLSQPKCCFCSEETLQKLESSGGYSCRVLLKFESGYTPSLERLEFWQATLASHAAKLRIHPDLATIVDTTGRDLTGLLSR